MMNRKAASYQLKDYLIASLFAGAVIGLFAIMVVSLADEYDNSSIIDPNYQAKYSEFNSYVSKVQSAKESLSSEGGLKVINIGFGIFEASFSFVQLILSSFGLIGLPTNNFTSDFAVPYQIAGILFTLFSSVIVIVLITRIYNSTTGGRF